MALASIANHDLNQCLQGPDLSTPLFRWQTTDGPFKPRCLVIEADPTQFLNQARPVAWQWWCLAGDFICNKNHSFLLQRAWRPRDSVNDNDKNQIDFTTRAAPTTACRSMPPTCRCWGNTGPIPVATRHG